MHTSWGEITVSDAHVHFFSHGFFSVLAQQKGITTQRVLDLAGWEAPNEDPALFAERWATELDRYGVGSAALIASVPGDEESVAAAVARFPARFYGYFIVNPLAPDAPERVIAAFAHGLRGVCLFPAMHRFSLHDEAAVRLIELAARQPGALVFVHCGVLTVGIRKRIGLASPFDMRFSNPIDVHGVALRFPQLPFVIPHFGAGYFREALMVADLCPNVHLDTSSSNSWTKYIAEQPSLRQIFDRALHVAGPRRLLFGTDSTFFPRGWHAAVFEEQARILWEVGASREDAIAVFGGNLRRLLQVESAPQSA
jgi:predicted TIM-barrel fold metal-dependent hydrolase